MSDKGSSPAPQSTRKHIKRPDSDAHKAKVAAVQQEIKQLDAESAKLTAEIAKLQIDQLVMDKRNKLQQELKQLIVQQGGIKLQRQTINDEIKKIDAQIKKRISEIQAQTLKNNFKLVAEIDARVNALDKMIDAGDLKLADERRYVKEMLSLRKLRKDFGGIEKTQALIDADKEKIAALKQKLLGVQNKELNAQFEKIQKELDEINNLNKGTIIKRNAVYDQRNALKKEKDAKWNEIRALRAQFDEQYKHFKEQMADEIKRREDEDKERIESEKAAKLKARAERELAAAQVPAFTAEINSIHSLLAYFDPEYVKPAAADPLKNGGFTTLKLAARTVEMPADMVVVSKKQEEFVPTLKLKKGKKAKGKSKNFTVDPDIITELLELSCRFPTSQEQVPDTIKVLKETLAALQDKQEEQTQVNIEKAKAKIATLEADDLDDEDDE